ncbi:LysR family transcriptional regulator [Paracoccus tibetensis]|uniref:DNA-binding transcriptional regulator, LysR family n=1 Tax=Paracoccus tibetensis TaxID=336292 RepID=A0A1G5I5T1_9RHOB|nr:LysR family transcriptional regulator [Paracoccus tibetensis]SCY71284.1 DNA-binding transcriptional regulator, LysR family [Paracoccus tibetensis]
MIRQNLNDLAAFAVIARTRSFTAAAAELGVSPSALSHAMRGLEARLDLRLLARTTRSVAPTEAGLALLSRLAPALAQIDAGLEALADWRDAPAGTVRVTTFHWIASTVLARKLPGFLGRHPGITVEVNVDDGLRDIVALGFDAGIRLGESVERDMIAVRIGPPLRTLVVATPGHWDAHGRPSHPRDLLAHPCITYRNLGSGTMMPWEFEKDGRELRLQVRGPLVCNSSDLALAAVRAGCGVGWTMAEDVADDLASGRLEQVLDEWSQPYPGAFLYHPSRRQVPPPLRALIAYLRQ